MLNFVICDDNLNILEKLSQMLEKIFIKNDYEAKITFKSDKPEKILEYVRENKVDVAILDIELKTNKSGLDLANEIRKINKDIYLIFTTAHLEYVMLAYKYKTFDYIPKPITYVRLEETISRLFEDINGLPKRYIKIDNKKTIIDESEVLYIKRDGMKLIFHTKSRDYETYSSFNKIQSALPNNFVRTHKSFIANINNITNLDPVSNIIYFNNDSTCDIGPKFKNDLIKEVNNNGYIK